MTTNPYLDTYNHNQGEQMLIDELVVESIKFAGMDVWYLPRKLRGEDDILNEDDISEFDEAYTIEMYLKTVDNFEGEGDFLSKFGLQIRDSMTMQVSMTRYAEEIGISENSPRPKEGDLVFFPMNKKLFEIMHVEHESIFYQLGALQLYELRMELFEYSNERIHTGIEEIDITFANRNTTSPEAIENVELIDPWADNKTIQDYANTILDFTENNPFGEDNY